MDLKKINNKCLGWWHTGWSSASSTRIAYGCWFMSLLLCFQSSSLIMAWESSGGGPKSCDPYPHGKPGRGSWFSTLEQLSSGCCSYLGGVPVDRKPPCKNMPLKNLLKSYKHCVYRFPPCLSSLTPVEISDRL